jgi:RHS repeat-associated protein
MSSLPQTLLCHYRYDALNRLIGHALPDTPLLQRFYCESRLAMEIEGVLQRAVVQFGSQLLAQKEGQDDKWSTTLLGTDLQRSVLHTLKANHQRHFIAFTPYGYCSAGSGWTSLLGYNGEQPDPVTWHYLLGNGYRAYNLVLMRFNRPDRMSPFGKGGLNYYAYCSGDPINRSDESGHVSMRLAVKLLQWRERAVTRVARRANLENIGIDGFKSLSKYLSRSDMDSVSLVSNKIGELASETSLSNLKTYLVSHQKNLHQIRRNEVMSTAGTNRVSPAEWLRIDVDLPGLKGIGSGAFKKLDASVKGPKSLAKYSNRVREAVNVEVNKGYRGSYTDWEHEINFRHVDRLLRPLQ